MVTVTIICRICHEPMLHDSGEGKSLLKLRVASRNSRRKDEEGKATTDFFNVIAFNGLAEHIAKHCDKSQRISIKGSLQNSVMGDEIIAEEVEFLDKHDQKGYKNDNLNLMQKAFDNATKQQKKEVLPYYE